MSRLDAFPSWPEELELFVATHPDMEHGTNKFIVESKGNHWYFAMQETLVEKGSWNVALHFLDKPEWSMATRDVLFRDIEEYLAFRPFTAEDAEFALDAMRRARSSLQYAVTLKQIVYALYSRDATTEEVIEVIVAIADIISKGHSDSADDGQGLPEWTAHMPALQYHLSDRERAASIFKDAITVCKVHAAAVEVYDALMKAEQPDPSICMVALGIRNA